MTKSKKEKVLDVVRTLNKHRSRKGKSVGEICDETGMFPSDVESTLKELRDSKVVKCYIYKGNLYAVFSGKSVEEALNKTMGKTTEVKMHG